MHNHLSAAITRVQLKLYWIGPYPVFWLLLDGFPLQNSLPHYCTISISTPVQSVTLGLPCRSLWPQHWAHLWCIQVGLCNSIMYGMSASNMHKLQSAQNSLLVWFCLLFAIFQQASDLVISTGFLSTTEYSSKLLHSPIDLINLSAILSLRTTPTTPAITSSPFFNQATTPSTIHVCLLYTSDAADE